MKPPTPKRKVWSEGAVDKEVMGALSRLLQLGDSPNFQSGEGLGTTWQLGLGRFGAIPTSMAAGRSEGGAITIEAT